MQIFRIHINTSTHKTRQMHQPPAGPSIAEEKHVLLQTNEQLLLEILLFILFME